MIRALLLGVSLVAAGPAAAPAQLVYVANQGSASVSVIDMATDQVVRTLDLTRLGFTENAKPHHVAVEPDGSAIYVSLIGDGVVVKLAPDGELLGRASFETPGMLALDPHSDRLWVGRSMMAVQPPQRIGRIERSTMSVEEIDVFLDRPHALALSPDGRFVYTASLAGNDVATIDVGSERVEPFRVEGPTHVFVQFAVSPDGRTLVTGGELSSRILVFDLGDPRRPELTKELEVGAMPWHPVFSPDGSRVYVGNRGANTVTVLRAADWTVEAVIEDTSFAEPHGSAVTPGGDKLYVSSRNVRVDDASGEPGRGRVSVIDTGQLGVIAVLEVGSYAAGIGTATPSR